VGDRRPYADLVGSVEIGEKGLCDQKVAKNRQGKIIAGRFSRS
jgi:hypothetical protein